MVKSIIAIAAFITSIMITANANAMWSYYDELTACHLDVDSWFFAELPENDTDNITGPNDVDRIRTIDGSFTLLDRIDVSSDFNILSISIPTYFYGLSGNLSYPTMYVTITSMHETDWTQDYYFHSNAITILPDTIGGDTAFYTIGAVIDQGGAQQAPVPVAHREVTVEIEIVGPVGVQHLVDQVRVNTTRNFNQSEGGCPH